MNWADALQETVCAFGETYPRHGENDCCQFVADYLDRMGRPVELPEYNAATADALLDEKSLYKRMRDVLGVTSDKAHPGDVVLCAAEELLTPAVWNGFYCVFYHPVSGVSRCDAKVLKAWAR